MIQYEYIYTYGKNLYARLFDSNTKKSKLFTLNKDDYTPELFMPTNDKTEYRSHSDNKFLKKIQFNSFKQLNDFIRENESYITLYGNKSPVMKFIRDNFSNSHESNHDYRTHFIDIETRVTLNEFPDAETVKEEVSLIQLYDTFEKKYYVLGVKDCVVTNKYNYGDVSYILCDNEKDLLNKWILLVDKLDPTIIVGFNTFRFDFPYLINRINKLNLKAERLSPIGVISSKPALTKDNIEYNHYTIVGRILLDYRELYMKYSFAKLPKHNLETIATYELGEGKIVHDEYDSFEEFYLNDYDKFVDYGIKDVELLISLDKKLKFIDTAKYIGYLCGVNLDDVMGTYKQWFSVVYNTALKNGEILPLSQQFSNSNDTFIGGWVLSKPGKYNWALSFDFASLYPSIIRLLNLGVDTLVKENELPEELKELREKYFFWYNDKKNEDLCKDKNNNLDEFRHIKFLMDNKEHIHSILSKYDVCASPNGYFYRKNKESIVASLMKKVYNERKDNKKLGEEYAKQYEEDGLEETKFLADMYDLYQTSLKILINSCYGSLSMDINAFSHGKGYSCAVTSGGRLSNRWCNYKINEGINKLSKEFKDIDLEKLPYTIQADTDSGYINVDYIVNKKGLYPTIDENVEMANKIGKNIIQNFIDEGINDICYLLNAYDESVLDMEQELIMDKFISTADKRYYARAWKKNKKTGKVESKMKITGLDIVSKSTPPWAKEKLKPILSMIMDSTNKEIINYIDTCKKEFYSAHPKDICKINGVSSINYTWHNDGKLKSIEPKNGKYLPAPINSRAAILHNEFIKENNMNHIRPIKAGDKVYQLFLKLPNKVKNQNVVGFSNPSFVKDGDIEKYIDYETLFEKNFLGNIKNITDAIGISLNKYNVDIDEWC